MPFEDNNFAIRTWNATLVSECCFLSKNVVFKSQTCVSVAEERPVLGIYSFAFGTQLNYGILQAGLSLCVNFYTLLGRIALLCT